MHRASLEPDPPFLSIQSRTYIWEGLLRHNHLHAPLVDSLVVNHLVLRQDVPVVAQEVLGFLECGYWQHISISQAKHRIKDSCWQTVSRWRSMMSINAEALFRFWRLMFLSTLDLKSTDLSQSPNLLFICKKRCTSTLWTIRQDITATWGSLCRWWRGLWHSRLALWCTHSSPDDKYLDTKYIYLCFHNGFDATSLSVTAIL